MDRDSTRSGALKLREITSLLDGERPITWVMTGASTTQGAVHTHGWRAYPEHFAERVRWELSRLDDAVINTAVSGSVAGDLVRQLDHRVTRYRPQVVTVMLGVNDAQAGPVGRSTFKADLTAIVRRTIEARAVPVLLTPPPVSSPDHADLPAYVDLIRAVADSEDVPLVDNNAHWIDAGAPAGWYSDALHPNETGHLQLARALIDALGINDPKSPLAQLEIP